MTTVHAHLSDSRERVGGEVHTKKTKEKVRYGRRGNTPSFHRESNQGHPHDLDYFEDFLRASIRSEYEERLRADRQVDDQATAESLSLRLKERRQFEKILRSSESRFRCFEHHVEEFLSVERTMPFG